MAPGRINAMKGAFLLKKNIIVRCTPSVFRMLAVKRFSLFAQQIISIRVLIWGDYGAFPDPMKM
jgi:hypothetical protein